MPRSSRDIQRSDNLALRFECFRVYNMPTMRATLTLPLLVVSAALTLQAGPIVQYQVTTVGTTSTGKTQYRYNYQFSGFTPFVNEEIDIRFDPTLFDELFNGVAGP